MKSTWNLNENSTGVLKVEVDNEAWVKAQEKALETLSKDIEIEGFRKGHAPKKLVEKQVGQDRILTEAVYEIADEAYQFGIDETKIEPVTRPSLDVETLSVDGVTLLFDVTVKPEVTLGEYKGLKVDDQPIDVTDEEVEERIEQIRQQNVELHLKENGTVENGDTAVIDFEGFKDGVAFEGGKGENYSLEIGSGSFIPGFEEALIGMKSEEEKDIEVTFPEEYQVEELAGQPVTFKVKVHEIKEKVVPELTDEFVEDLGDDSIATVEDLRKAVREDLELNRKQEEEDRVTEAILLQACENATVEIPETMIEEELNQMFNEFNQRLAQQGMNFEMYSQILGVSEEDIKNQMKDDAEKRVKSRLVLESVIAAEALEIAEEEINAEYTKLAEMYGLEIDNIQSLISKEQIEYDTLMRKAIELLKNSRA